MKPTTRWQATVLLLCLPFISFWKIFFAHSDYTFFTTGDAALHWYPWYQYIARWMHSGTLPLWDSILQSGRPLLGEMRPGVLYPLNLLFFRLFSTKDGVSLLSMDLFIVLEVVLASVFQYKLARHLALSRYASLLSAIIYGYCGYVAENAVWQIAIFHGIIWFPLLILLFLRSYESDGKLPRAFYLISSGVVFGVMILAGHIQPPVHAALCLGALAIYLPLTSIDSDSPWIGLSRSALRLGCCIFIGLLVAAPQLLVSWEYGKHSLRWLGWDDLAPVNGLSRIPYAWGGHFERGHIQDIFTAVNPGTWAGSDYFGATALLLVIVAFLLARGIAARLFKILLICSILLWLGELSVVHGLFYQLLPIMDKVRQPSRAIFLIHFCVATLAGFGADLVARCVRSRYKKAHYHLALILVWISGSVCVLIYVAGMLAVLFKLSSMTDVGLEWTLRAALLIFASAAILYLRQIGRLRLSAFRLFLLLLITFDLLSVFSYTIGSRYDYNNKNNYFPTVHYAGNQAVNFLTEKAQVDIFRVEVLEDALPQNSGMVNGYQEIMGGMATGLEIFHRFRGLDENPHSIISRLLNRRYIASRRVIDGFDEVVQGSPRIYKDPDALDRATWVPRAIVLDNLDAVARALQRPGFNPREAILVTRDQSRWIPPDLLASGLQDAGTGPSPQVNIASYQPNNIVLTLKAPQKGILLLSEIAYPGWRATVDGLSVPIVTADYLFRAVVVGEGNHTIEFAYKPALFSVGLGVSLAVFLVPAVLAIPLVRRRLISRRQGMGK